MKTWKTFGLWGGMITIYFKCYVTTHGVTKPGKPAPKRREDILGTNYLKEIPRPAIIAKYQDEMGYVDRHNSFRQGTLQLAKIWKTKRWQTRIQLELLGLAMVDAFLACRRIMPKWQDVEDSDSIFWKFVHTVIGQIDNRPMFARQREGEEGNPTLHCKHVPIGLYKVQAGKYKGNLKSKQAHCKYCSREKEKMAKMGLRPLHGFDAAFMRSLFVGNTIVGNAIWVRLNEMHVTNLAFSLPLFYRALHYFFCTICRICIC